MSEGRSRALITGASSGLGAEFSRQLAASCDELILVARSSADLASQAEALARPGLLVHTVAADLSTTIGLARIVETIRQKGPLDYLINNAGFTTLGPFAQSHLPDEVQMVALHVNASLTLCRAALPFMLERSCGAIINVASVAGLVPVQDAAVYSGTKAFLVNFSRTLALELADTPITVQCLCPGFTHTRFHATQAFANVDLSSIPAALWAQPQEVVSASLAALAQGLAVVVPGEVNQQQVARSLQRLQTW